MSLSNYLFKSYVKIVQKLMRNSIDLPAEREIRNKTFKAEVINATDLAPHLRRVTLHAPDFTTFDITGADEWIGLIMPKPGEKLHMPDPDNINIRAAVKNLPVDLRWYTVRELRRDTAEMDIDVVTHGANGPGSAWFLTAKPGMEVGVTLGASSYYPHDGTQFYVADPSAAPALRAILSSMDDKSNIHVLLNGKDEELEADFPTDGLASFRRNQSIADYTADLPFDTATLNYAWLCGESSLATGFRRALVELGVPKNKMMFSGYWKEGVARK